MMNEYEDETAQAMIIDITPKQAMDALRKAVRADYDYAWSWHCNIAMVAIDAGATHKTANERAAGFMWRTFGVNTSVPPQYVGQKER